MSVWDVYSPSASQPLLKQFQQELLLSSESFFSVLSALQTGMIIIIDNHAGMIIFRLCFVSPGTQAYSPPAVSTCNKGSIGKCNIVLKPANLRHAAALGSF